MSALPILESSPARGGGPRSGGGVTPFRGRGHPSVSPAAIHLPCEGRILSIFRPDMGRVAP
jgi:hypothetical protein